MDGLPFAIDLPPVSDPDDEDHESLLAYIVEHTVIAESYPPDRFLILRHEANRSTRSRVDLEASQGADDATPTIGR